FFDSDPIHRIAFLRNASGDEDYFAQMISGKHDEDIAAVIFQYGIPRGLKFCEDKEEYFRKLVKEKVELIKGLYMLTKWVEVHGLKPATVTNAPRPNAELMISTLGLADFFHLVIICGSSRSKPNVKANMLTTKPAAHSVYIMYLVLYCQKRCLNSDLLLHQRRLIVAAGLFGTELQKIDVAKRGLGLLIVSANLTVPTFGMARFCTVLTEMIFMRIMVNYGLL
nr:haloacid dehalogenase-like hydrolase domain-containing protein Sgpp [Tanacetum cinerariifolium]